MSKSYIKSWLSRRNTFIRKAARTYSKGGQVCSTTVVKEQCM
ncbi:hypothetical protein [Marinilabilia rubra]|nr:hypothetical protein [Marinilabilia rubra]